MKSIVLITVVQFAFAFSIYGQYTDSEGNLVTGCDCKDPVRDLNTTVTLPDNYATYDYIQYVLYSNGSPLSSRNMRAENIQDATVRLNILNPNNRPLRGHRGREYNRFQGDDFARASYNTLCESEGDVEIQVIAYGISQVGTETVYEVDPTGTKLVAKTFQIYDDGVELAQSEKISFRQDKEYSRKIIGQDKKNFLVNLIALGASAGGIATFFIVF
jgi:hypothetical protein